MAEKRIYKVTSKIDGHIDVRLVKATNAAQAIKHVTKATVECEVCSVDDAIRLGASGTAVETAGEAESK